MINQITYCSIIVFFYLEFLKASNFFFGLNEGIKRENFKPSWSFLKYEFLVRTGRSFYELGSFSNDDANEKEKVTWK